ncbi:alpha/beta hydrolase [Georgenia halophila]|uniref:Alpha/beta hydrolase n=1 Tax=Georgenia halophila TaxID=620889 RepID=A0ABP8KXM0_9MICO
MNSQVPDSTTVKREGGKWVRVHRVRQTGRHARAERPSFILLHGIGVSSRYFLPLTTVLAEHGDVLLLDLPGFAGLPRPERPLGIEDFAAVVADVLDAAGVTEAILVGQSMGTQVATELLATRPDLARGAVLVGPTTDASARRVRTQLLRFVRTVVHEPRRMRAIAIRAYLACGPRWYLQVLPAMMSYPTEDRLGRVSAPVEILRGEHDEVSPARWTRLLASRVPGGRTRTVAGAAHSVVLDHAAEVADAALDVLARVRRRSRPPAEEA